MTQVNAKIPTTVESTVVRVIAWAKQETSHCPNQCWARGPFHQRFSILIQIGGQILGFRVTPSLGTISLQNCTHTTTVQESCHARNFTVITFVKKNPTVAEWNFHQTCINMDKMSPWNGPKIYVAIRRIYAKMWHGATVWRHITRLTMVQLIPCYVTTAIHYMNGFIICKIPWHSFEILFLHT